MTTSGNVNKLEEYRCMCGKLLFRGQLVKGTAVEVKCKRCNKTRLFTPELTKAIGVTIAATFSLPQELPVKIPRRMSTNNQ